MWHLLSFSCKDRTNILFAPSAALHPRPLIWNGSPSPSFLPYVFYPKNQPILLLCSPFSFLLLLFYCVCSLHNTKFSITGSTMGRITECLAFFSFFYHVLTHFPLVNPNKWPSKNMRRGLDIHHQPAQYPAY